MRPYSMHLRQRGVAACDRMRQDPGAALEERKRLLGMTVVVSTIHRTLRARRLALKKTTAAPLA